MKCFWFILPEVASTYSR